MNLILLAAPGAGKGTQAEMLCEKFGIPTISTGAMLRASIADKTELGKIAEKYINDGRLVPDDVMIELVKNRISEDDCKNGFILDGFPRTLVQAEALSRSDVKIDKVLNIEVPDEKIIERLAGRLECKSCGSTYHVQHRPPKVEGKCDRCGGELRVREDDKPETVKQRLNTYHTQTKPLVDYYRQKGMLRVAYGQEKIEDTKAEVLKALGV